MTHPAESNYYELLDVPPGSSPAEIDEAYKRQMELLSGEALATYGLFVGDDLVTARQRVEDAYRVLKDPVRRQAYDDSGHTHAPPETPAAPEAVSPPEAPAPEMPVTEGPEAGAPATPGPEPSPEGGGPEAPAAAGPEPDVPAEPEGPEAGPWDGASLRAARERHGVSLGVISSRTRIAEYYLEYIEEERFDALPPALYLRAYLRQYAQAIGVDVEHAVDGYLSRYNEAKGKT